MPDPSDIDRLSDLPLSDLVACHECDLLMRKPQLAHGEKAECPRCGYELYAHRHDVVNRSLALVLAALLLFVPANFLPIMQLHLLGQTSDDTVWSGVVGLYNSQMRGVAVVVDGELGFGVTPKDGQQLLAQIKDRLAIDRLDLDIFFQGAADFQMHIQPQCIGSIEMKL